MAEFKATGSTVNQVAEDPKVFRYYEVRRAVRAIGPFSLFRPEDFDVNHWREEVDPEVSTACSFWPIVEEFKSNVCRYYPG